MRRRLQLVGLALALAGCSSAGHVADELEPVCRAPEPASPAPRQVAVAHEAVCAIVCGSIHCWGAGLEPTRLDDPRTFVAIDGSDGAFCALTESSQALCFRLEDREWTMTPLPPGREFVEIVDSCVRDVSGTIECYGSGGSVVLPTVLDGLIDLAVSPRDIGLRALSFTGLVSLDDGVVQSLDHAWWQPPGFALGVPTPVGFVVGELRVAPWPKSFPEDYDRPPWLAAACAWSGIAGEPVRCLGGRERWIELVDTAATPRAVMDVEIGHAGVCILYDDGELHCPQPGQALVASELGESLRVELDGAPLMTNVVDVDVDAKLACALTAEDGVFCWGNNEELAVTGARLSIADDANRVVDDFVDLSLGGDHACGLTTRGTVRCWGAIGGVPNLRVRDALELPMSNVTSMAALDRGATRVVDAEGRLWWGSRDWHNPFNDYDAPEFPPNNDGTTPEVAAVFDDLVIEAGMPVPLDAIGRPRATLLTAEGELLQSTSPDTWEPVELPAEFWPPAIALGGGEYRCAIDAEARGWCENRRGEWEVVLAGERLVDIAAPCAVTAEQRVTCWGDDADSPLAPGVVEGLAPVRRIESDGERACALEADGGAIVCWGEWFAQRSRQGGVYGRWIDVPVEVPISRSR